LDTFSQDWRIFRVLTFNEPRLATKYELDTIYTVSDLYDFLEIIDAKQALDNIIDKKVKARQREEKSKVQANKRKGR